MSTSTVKPPKLAIIAGQGPLPIALANAAKAAGRDVFIVALEGESDRAIERFPHVWLPIGAMGRFLKLLKDEACEEIVLIGPIVRPDLSKIRPDMVGLKLLPRFIRLLRQGDDGLLRGIVEFLEKDHGFRVVAPEQVSADLRAPAGVLTKASPTTAQQADIERAVTVLDALGPLDVGQAVAVCRGVVLAVEASEGTDAMLDRIATLGSTIRGTTDARDGVLVKQPKTGQERRIDLPTIGVQTVDKAAAAGLAGIVVEAGGALIYDVTETIRTANAHGLFIIGLASDKSGPAS